MSGRQAVGDEARMGTRLLEIVRDMTREVNPQHAERLRVTPRSRLDRDLGLDSLARAELLLRIEREFGIDMPTSALTAESPQALLHHLLTAKGRSDTDQGLEPFPLLAPTPGAPEDAETLSAVLDWHLQSHPQRTHLFVYGDSGPPVTLSYSDLHRGAGTIAAGLQAAGIGPGNTVALMLPTSIEYFHTFFGVLYAGAVPVPLYPPVRTSQLEDHLRRHGRILTNAAAAMLITVPGARAVERLLQAEAPQLRRIATVAELTSAGSSDPQPLRGSDLALLQYTSGSTGEPKGVMLSHLQLLANIRALGERLEVDSRDVFVSWLPLYHDMGLIGAWFGSLYYAVPLAVMPPLSFLARPVRWLRAIHRHRASISGGPNFGYELCLRALEREELEGLSLENWRIAFNGAEPVSAVTLERFQRALAPYGLRREALAPVYGLAEAAVGLTIPPAGRGPVIDRVQRAPFAHHGYAAPAGEETRDMIRIVGCGPPLPGYEVRVVDESGHELAERHEGNLEFRGPSTTAGYYRNPTATRALHHGDWLITGDRGYIAGGEVFVSGRSKDLIVRGGRNLYPYELEEAVGSIPGVRKGCVAVFGDQSPATGIERLVVVAETRETDPDKRSALEAAIRDVTVDVLNVPADDIRLVPPHSVLKTSSGKIRRPAIHELYRHGRLGAQPAAVWRQIAHLALETQWARLRRRIRRYRDWVYAAYAWCVFGLAALVVWLSSIILPRRRWRWRLARGVIQLAALLTAIRIQRNDLDRLPQYGPYILVANHASYLDALVLIAAIPHDFRFLAKRELSERFFARVLLQRLGAVFVERFDPQRASADTQAVFAAADAGESMAFFPEGTFGRAPGLRSFHLGAFLTATHSGLPVVPVALHGSRSLLRGDEWFPRPGRVHVSVGPTLRAPSDDWAAAVWLRDQARAFILAGCGEPDLAAETGTL